jgi:MFS family permease
LPHAQEVHVKKPFYGWLVTAAAFVTFGFAVGLPYYNISFFYDYFAKTFHWTAPQITLGFPLAALPTIFIAPLLIHRFSPRKLILGGTLLTCIALVCFGLMGPNIWIYWGIWVIYAIGYMLSGPIPHQIIIAQWFRTNRGKAMGVLYVGVGVMGFLGSYLVKPLTEHLGFHNALMIMGGMVLLAWPLALFVLRDRPAEKGLYPDGAAEPSAEVSAKPHSFGYLLHRYSFWLLVFGSMCSIGSIGAVNFLMKLVFDAQMTVSRTDPSFQPLLNSTWRAASMIILASSIGGRLIIGASSDRFPKKWVMVISYFLSATTIPILLSVAPPQTPWVFAVLFGFAMGADYMLIPLMAAHQFGVNSLARAMAIILPANTIAQTWFPYFISVLKQYFGNYTIPMYTVFGVACLSGLSIALLPRKEKEEEALGLPEERPVEAQS